MSNWWLAGQSCKRIRRRLPMTNYKWLITSYRLPATNHTFKFRIYCASALMASSGGMSNSSCSTK
jgi:hypothetical protein